jgi:pyruvate-formate lyase-activating enzyme
LRIYDLDYEGKRPERFLRLSELIRRLEPLPLKRTILMGAEPLCDPRFAEILGYIKGERRCAVTLLTNGKVLPHFSLVDEVVFSLKALEPSLHRDYTGEDNQDILENFRATAKRKDISLHVETVFIPEYVDEGEILDIASFIASVDPTLPLRIDAYLPVGDLPWRAPGDWELKALSEKARAILPNTTCLHGRGGKEALAYEVERIF